MDHLYQLLRDDRDALANQADCLERLAGHASPLRLQLRLQALARSAGMRTDSMQRQLLCILRSRHRIADHLLSALQLSRRELDQSMHRAIIAATNAMQCPGRHHRLLLIACINQLATRLRQYITLEKRLLIPLLDLLLTSDKLNDLIWQHGRQPTRKTVAFQQIIRLIDGERSRSCLH